jgi:FtsP/CotA-like multicopper oxidase with cupredoxin domain
MAIITRRQFLGHGARGLSAVLVGSAIGIPALAPRTKALASGATLELSLVEVNHEMVDRSLVYSWAFAAKDQGPAIPGPVIFATEGETIRVSVSNPLDEAHAFAVMSGDGPESFVGGSFTGPLSPGESAEVSFDAPAAGTYIYCDPLRYPVNRVLGLHGVLVVLPNGEDHIPYSNAPSELHHLFEDLGHADHFSGEKWNPKRTNIWVFSHIDPSWNDRARQNAAIDPAEFLATFDARYHTLNGMSGIFAAHDHSMSYDGHEDPTGAAIMGKVGQPRLIRNVNVGMCQNSPHVHANHAYLVALNGNPRRNVLLLDTWHIEPGARADVLYPMIMPPDIPADTVAKLMDGTSEEGWPGYLVRNPMFPAPTPFPLHYPMHCHLEMSQTAAGGNYPHGIVTHIEFTGISDSWNPQHH